MNKAIIIFSLLIFFNIVSCLPIFSTTATSKIISITASIYSSQKIEDNQDTLTNNTSVVEIDLDNEKVIVEEEENVCPETEYGIPVERFAQLVSTHWQFDHLDAIKSGTYKIISEKFQKHIEISIEALSHREQEPQELYAPKRQRSFNTIAYDMMMDLEILHAQIFGAIQAHTEGSLHLAWDRLSDKLGQPALEHYIKSITLKHCTFSPDLLSSTCLKQNEQLLEQELNDYIFDNLNSIFDSLENDVLPTLLSNTSKDLYDVLSYFNRLFLQKDNQHLLLKVTPWNSLENNLKDSFMHLLQIDNHLVDDFFKNYACLSRA